jgi:hypothetical protein
MSHRTIGREGKTAQAFRTVSWIVERGLPALQDSSLGQVHFAGLMRRQGAAKGGNAGPRPRQMWRRILDKGKDSI